MLQVGKKDPRYVAATATSRVRVNVAAGSTLYYSTSSALTSGVNEGSLTVGQEKILSVGTYFLSAGTTSIGTAPVTELTGVDLATQAELDAGGGGGVTAGAAGEEGKVLEADDPTVEWVLGAEGIERYVKATGVAATDTANLKAALEASSTLPIKLQGTYQLNGELPAPAKRGVEVRGGALGHTILEWKSDLGAGKYAIDWSASGASGLSPILKDVWLKGPKAAVVSETAEVEMDGFRPAATSSVIDVKITQFRAGLCIAGDHINIERGYYTNNFFNELYEDQATNKGNVYHHDVNFTGPGYASVCTQGNALISANGYDGCHFGYGPYGLIKQAGPVNNGNSSGWMTDTHFRGCAWEQIGQGAIHDFTSGSPSMDGVTIDQAGFSWDSNGSKIYTIGGLGGSKDEACITVNAAKRTKIAMGLSPFTAGTHCVFYSSITNFSAEIDYGAEGESAVASNLVGDGTKNSSGYLGITTVKCGDKWKGVMAKASGAITSGDPLEWATGTALVGKYGTIDTKDMYGSDLAFAGIAAHTAISGAPVLVVTEGMKAATSAATSGAGQLLCANPVTGKLAVVEGSGKETALAVPNGYPIVAESIKSGSEGSILVFVRKQGRNPAFVAPRMLANGTSLPTAEAFYNGQIVGVKGNGSSVADIFYICKRAAAGTYSWVELLGSAAASEDTWHPYVFAAQSIPSATTASTYAIPVGSSAAAPISLSSTNGGDIGDFWWEPAAFEESGKTLKCRLDVVCLTSETASTITHTVGLYPISSVSGSSTNLNQTAGTVVEKSTVKFENQAKETKGHKQSEEFAAPSAGLYSFGDLTSNTNTTNARTNIKVQLQYRNI